MTFQSHRTALLASGTEETFDVYDVTVLWDRQSKYVDTFAADATPLVGMSMIEGHDLHVRVEDGGRVTIEPKV